MPLVVDLFICRKDNYGALVHDTATGRTAAIDAPDAAAISAALSRRGWRLSDIFITHHHADHVQGVLHLIETHQMGGHALEGIATRGHGAQRHFNGVVAVSTQALQR